MLPGQPFSYSMWINGREIAARSGKQFNRESPAHGVKVGVYPLADADDVDRAVAAARRAFEAGPWPKMSGAERSRCLLKVAEAIRTQKGELARIETLESGKPIRQARDEMEWSAGLWDYAAALSRHVFGDAHNALGDQVLGLVLHEPIGVVGMITPWNFPLLIISQKLPFALAAGCACRQAQ
jgi:betaine-aldehyde dehydrogenase